MKLIYLIASSTILIASCSAPSDSHQAEKTEAPTTEVASVEKVAAPTLTINEADWVEQDLKPISSLTPITLKLPKGVKMEKNGNGGVDIHISDFYMITVGANASSKVEEAMNDQKSLTINNTASYKNGKVISEEPNKGFVYSMQMNDEENGTKYEPEAHFAYYLEKDGAIYSIADQRPLDNFSVTGSAYTEAIAKKIFDIVKSSAKVI